MKVVTPQGCFPLGGILLARTQTVNLRVYLRLRKK